MSSIAKLLLLLPLAAFLLPLWADDQNLDQVLTLDNTTTPPTYMLSWWGKEGYSYLAESTPDLVTWTQVPNFNPRGADDVLSVSLALAGTRNFFRVVQFDPNDLTGLADSDSDGLPDRWELYYFGTLDRDGSGDWTNDGLLDRDAFRFGLNPKGSDESLDTGKFDVFSYDARGWMDGLTATGSITASYTLDKEGNIKIFQ